VDAVAARRRLDHRGHATTLISVRSMFRIRRATVVAALALGALGSSVALALDAVAQVPPLSSSSAASATPSPSPSPTPCPTDLTGTLCQGASVPGGSSPTPSPTPTPTPTAAAYSATPQPSKPAPAPAGGATPTHPSAPPPPPPAAPSTVQPASAATIATISATFRNAPFLGQLLTILSHPTGAQRPDLRHFRPAVAAGSVDAAGGPSGPGAPGLALVARQVASSPAPAVAIALLGTLLVACATLLVGSAPARLAVGAQVASARLTVRRGVVAAWRLHPSVHRIGVLLHRLLGRARHGLRTLRGHLGVPHFAVRTHSHRGLAVAACIATLPALLAGLVLGNAEVGHGGGLARAGSAPTSTYLQTEVSLDAAIPVGEPVSPPTWTRLVTIERGLLGQQDELTAQEAAITRLAVNLAGEQPDDDGPVSVGQDAPPQLHNQLALLLAAHTATQAAYQQSLQAEYDFYRAAAQDPAQRAQLTAEAAAVKQPQVKDAVSYNLSLVQTQLAQEAQISGAEAQLQQIGSLGQAQLEAMRHHQPFIAPVNAAITQTFGPTDFSLEPPLSYNGTFYPHFHTGLDLGAPLDTPVHAAADGVVLLAAASVDSTGKLVGYGNYVVVAHPDGFVTLYGHLDTIAVKAGQVVHQGEIVGQEGSTGWSTGPHVHFEIRHDGQFLDPAPFLAGQLPAQ